MGPIRNRKTSYRNVLRKRKSALDIDVQFDLYELKDCVKEIRQIVYQESNLQGRNLQKELKINFQKAIQKIEFHRDFQRKKLIESTNSHNVMLQTCYYWDECCHFLKALEDCHNRFLQIYYDTSIIESFMDNKKRHFGTSQMQDFHKKDPVLSLKKDIGILLTNIDDIINSLWQHYEEIHYNISK